MLERFRQYWARLLSPIADFLLARGVSPDAVTLVGTLGVSLGALVFFPRGWLWQGALVITAFVFSDLLDGSMARSAGTSSRWGAFLDSTLDRIGDASVFGGLVLWFARGGDDPVLMGVALYCLVMGSVTSYARARAESLGMHAKGGIAERADRLSAVLVLTFFADLLDQVWLLALVLWVLAAATTLTVVHRVLGVRRQAMTDQRPPASPGAAAQD